MRGVALWQRCRFWASARRGLGLGRCAGGCRGGLGRVFRRWLGGAWWLQWLLRWAGRTCGLGGRRVGGEVGVWLGCLRLCRFGGGGFQMAGGVRRKPVP